MIRWLTRASRSAALTILCATTTAAQADVLEIDRSGARWIAGGAAATAMPVSASGDPAPVSNDRSQAPLTKVAQAAGPEQWQSHVAYLSAKYDLSPQLIDALVWQESRWKTGAISPVGARGLAQLMPGTARQMGVDSSDPHANLEGGARYLRMQLDAFGGNIEKALASYNAGPGRVHRAGGIPNIRETQLYVAAILARLSNPVRR